MFALGDARTPWALRRRTMDSYNPSWLWMLVCAVVKRPAFPPNPFRLYCTHYRLQVMSDTPDKSQITLPGIQEMLPDHLFQPSDRTAIVHGPRLHSYHADPAHASPSSHGVSRGIRAMVVDTTRSPQYYAQASSSVRPASPPFAVLSPSSKITAPQQLSPASSHSSVDIHDFYLTSPIERRDPRSEDKRHICRECGRAFNRPSSLDIHMNIHTGKKPFECTFPGCGKRFNVNSNMRRHLRNHLSPSRSTASSPYTYPLTTIPRPLPGSPGYDTHTVTSRTRSSTMSYSTSIYTDSEEEDVFNPQSNPVVSHFDNNVGIQEASARMRRLRLRSQSSPGARPPREHIPHTYPSESHRRRSNSCNVPGCRCINRPM